MKNNIVLSGMAVLLVLGSVWYLLSVRNPSSPIDDMESSSVSDVDRDDQEDKDAMEDETMDKDDEADEEEDEKEGDKEGSLSMEVEGGMYYFKPNEMRVTKGKPVRIVLKSKEGLHDFVIDELNVKSERVSADNTTVVTFTPQQAGTYEYYCSVGNHREMGMVGKLIVE